MAGLRIKRFLPRSLYGRALLIIVSPLVLLQILSSYYFYAQHWEAMSRRLSLGVAGDVAFIIDEFELVHGPVQQKQVERMAVEHFGLRTDLHLGEILPNNPPRSVSSSLAKMLGQALLQQVRRPVVIDDTSDEHDVIMHIQLPEGVLYAEVSRKRLFSVTTYTFILWMVGSSLVLFAIASLFMRNQVRPIRRLADAAERFGKGREIHDFKPEGASEVRRAAIEFNRMRERITRAITQRTEMLAGVSHDLRTPLTRLKLQLALLGDDPEIDELKMDVAEMAKMIDGYLAFARGEGGEATRQTALGALLADIVANARREGAAVELAMDEPIELALRPDAFRRSVTNLVANAARYGSYVKVSAHRRGAVLELTVDDDGPGIPPDRRDDVFKPFFRLDSSRNPATGGVGLGLTIARDIVRGQGGELALAQSPLGGLRAIVTLPL